MSFQLGFLGQRPKQTKPLADLSVSAYLELIGLDSLQIIQTLKSHA
ncbi:hypothetical protein [Helicobacter pylori]|nr:hypothetical protein [Helicobacter pylori]